MGAREAWWSSRLLIVEFRRLGTREGLHAEAEKIIESLRFMLVDASVLERASRLAPVDVRALDAIHLDTAVALRDRAEVVAVLTYDRQLQAGCAHHGIPVEAPTVT